MVPWVKRIIVGVGTSVEDSIRITVGKVGVELIFMGILPINRVLEGLKLGENDNHCSSRIYFGIYGPLNCCCDSEHSKEAQVLH